MTNHIDRKGIPPVLGQGEYPSYLYGFKNVSKQIKCHWNIYTL